MHNPSTSGALTVHQRFEMQVERTPDAIALATTDQQITYQDLNARANQLAHHLRSLGVGPEVLVGLCVERSIEMIVGLLSILKAGAAYVPLDPTYPPERLAFMLADADVPVLLTQAHLVESLPSPTAQIVYLDRDWPQIAAQSQENPDFGVEASNLAYVIYTSGSTGKPKGVLIQHDSLLNYTEAVLEAYELSQRDRVLQFSSISFDVSAEEIYPCLSVGATLVLRTDAMLESVTTFLHQCQEWRLTALSLPTAYWHELTLKLATDHLALPESLRLIVIGGERAWPTRLRLWQQQVGQTVRLINAYGPTEATISALICDLSELALEADLAEVPIGQPIRNLQAYVLDQNLQPVAPGAIAELYLGGVGLARGYLHRPDLTAKKFIANPFSSEPEARLYKTGDLVRRRVDGNYEYIGRIDDQVKIRGFRIELGEIETVLGQHPQVETVVVTTLADQQSREQRLVAYVVSTAATTAHFSTELRRFLQARLPHYMIPAAFVRLEALPLTPNGKVDKRSLPLPDLTAPERTVEFVAPRTAIESTLAEIWSQVLAVAGVGVLDNFWELGGESLSAIQLLSRIQAKLQVELSLRTLFQAPTIAELAKVLEASETSTISLPPIQPVARDRVLPLSLGQQHLWLLQQLEPDQPIWNEPVTLLLPGSIQVAALEQAFNALIQRHESLRTNFLMRDGQPVQVIRPERAIALSVIDLTASPTPATEARRIATQAAAQPFDLGQDLLLRVTLIQLRDTEIQLHLTLHHLIFDGVSFVNILLPELTTLYQALAQGHSPQLPELTLQYADFAAWQQEHFGSEAALHHPRVQTQLAYWQQQLADLLTLNLPSDRPRPTVPTFGGAKQAIALSQPLTEALHQLSRQSGVTLFTTLLAAFKAWLYRYVGSDDIGVSTITAGRHQPELEPVVGYFLNNLLLRTDCSGNPNFLELLPRVQETVLQAQAHQDIPFQALLKQLRHPNQNSPFQVLFVLEPPTPKNELGWAIAPLHQSLDTGIAKLDLSVYWEQTETGLVGFWEYNTDLFDATTIARMVEHFQILLEGIVTDPTRSLATLPLLSSKEQQLLKQWQHPVQPELAATCIHQRFEAQVKQTPDAIAVIFGTQQLTYQELNSRANQLAHYLRTLGVQPESLVGLGCDRSLEMVIGLLGILKAGGAYVPLDPAYPSERLAWMLEDAQISILLTQSHLLSELPQHSTQVVCLDKDWPHIAQHSGENPVPQATSDNLAYIIYTSGSTGKPKGVMIEHGSLINYTDAAIATYEIKPSDRILQFASISFDASVEEIYPGLCTGATLILRTELMLESVATFLQTCEQQQLTLVSLPTAYWHEIVAAMEAQALPLPSHLRLVIIGGEKALPARVTQWQQYVGQLMEQKIRLVNTYGPTESTVVATTYDLSTSSLTPHTVPIGRSLPHIETYVLDRHQQLVPIGVAGELYLGGGSLARGYLNRSELTAEKFIPQPFSDHPQTKLYRTGDLVRCLPDGNLEYLGRIDQQVKIRGFRIELGEIEAALQQHPALQAAVVSDREDAAGQKYLVAYAVPKASDPVSTQQLRSFLQGKLPAYMMPSTFVLLASLPLTPSGKVDRRALPAPELTTVDVGALVAPRTAVEAALAEIWAEVLGLERVGITDNFFELGGHSLLGTQMISRVRQHLQVELPLRSLFSAPTIETLAQWVTTAQPESQAPQTLIPSISRDQPLLLSFSQQRLWFLDQLIPNSPFYNISQAVRLTGTLNVLALEQSLNEIVQRHESLRTSFIEVNGQPTQKIAPELKLTLEIADLTHLPATERETQAQQQITATAQQPFSLAETSLLRCQVWRLSEQEHILLLTMHHIISDAWSIGVLVRELATLYEAHTTGQSVSLPQPPIQYADFAHWQREWLQGDRLESQLAYWKQQLAGAPEVLNLPSDRPRPLKQSLRGATQAFTLPLELMTALQELSQREGATLFMTLLAAFQVLLYRYSGQPDIVVGSPIANRHRAEIEDLIGFFVNTLVLRTDLSGNPSFQQLLSRVREMALGAYAHQDVPFEQLVEALQPTRDLAYTPLFQVMFVLQNVPASELELPGLTMTPLSVDSDTAKFDLALSLDETERGLVGIWEYNTDLFDASTIARLTGHFQTLLTGIVANAQQAIAQLSLLTLREQQQLTEWKHTQAVYPSNQTIHQWFEAQAEKTPEAIALIFAGQSLTYRELNERSNQLAHYLKALGVQPEVLVGICVDRSFEMIIGILGILKAGGAYVPLDPKYPSERLSFMLEDTQAPLLLTQAHLVASLPSHPARVICLDADWEAILASTNPQAVTNPVSGANANSLAYVIYTSGSTGKPKGVMIEHRSLVNYTQAAIALYEMQQSDRVLQFASVSFDASAEEIYPCLCVGATLMLRTEWMLESVSTFLQTCEQWQLTLVSLPTAYWHEIVGAMETQTLPIPSHLRLTIIGGEKASPTRVAQWQQWVGAEIRLVNTYGPTESTVVATTYDLSTSHPASFITPIGQAMPQVETYVLDRYQELVPIGVAGELYLGGAGLARGYLNRPELTVEKFVAHPFSDCPEARLYRTGDLVRYLPDGNLEYLGRIDQQVKIRGFRIELGEIEATLTQHPDVKEAVVLIQEHNPNDKRLVAYVVSKLIPDRVPMTTTCWVEIAHHLIELTTEDLSLGGLGLMGVPTSWQVGQQIRVKLHLPVTAEPVWLEGIVAWGRGDHAGIQFNLSAAEQILVERSVEHLLQSQGLLKVVQRTVTESLRRFLKQKLPDYMVPSSFVPLSALPLTPNGKVDRRALATYELASAPELGVDTPRTLTEEMLAGIWAEVLGLERVGIHDNFFELGGHSLLAIQIISRIRSVLQVELPLRNLFEFPTIATLAQSLASDRLHPSGQQAPPILPVDRNQPLPLSFPQQQMWLLSQVQTELPAYNYLFTFQLPGLLNPTALEQALNEIIRRHEAWRTNFVLTDGSPVQVIHAARTVQLPKLDLRSLAATERESEAMQRLSVEVQRPFDLAADLLLRPYLIRLDETDYRLCLVLHHIIYDGLSLVNFLQELEVLYKAFCAHKPSPLPELAIQYADFAAWQRQWLQPPILEPHLAYWQQQLADLPTLQLPCDRPRPAHPSFVGHWQELTLSKTLTEQLKALSRREGVTLFMTLQAAFKTLLHRYSGQTDIPVGMIAAEPDRPELKPLIGFFVNFLVLRTDLSGNPSFRDLLHRVREVTLSAYAHREVPFDQLAALRSQRHLGQNPLYQVMLLLDPAMPSLESGWTVKQMDTHNGMSRCDLTLEFHETADGLVGEFEYSTDLFDAPTITRMMGHFQTLLEAIVADPTQPLSNLSILTAAEKQQIQDWHQTQVDYSLDICLHQWIEAQVERTPEAIAVRFADQTLTYRELNAKANQLAHHLRKLHVQPETLVGICVDRSLEMVIGLLGILKAGGAYVPFDPGYPPERLAFMLADAQVPVLLSQSHFSDRLPPHQATVINLDRDWQSIALEADQNLDSGVTAENLAYVIYTSGSTGKPKGAMNTHRGICNRLLWMQNAYPLTERDRVLQKTPFSFDVSVWEFFWPLMTGAELVVARPEGHKDPTYLVELIAQQQITTLHFVPSMLRVFLEEPGLAQCCCLRQVMCSGEALPVELQDRFFTRLSAQLHNLYGPTEAAVDVTFWHCQPEANQTLVPIGRPIANTQIHLLDPHLQPVPIGVVGELYIGGVNVARGYLHRPELTQERFLADPLSGEPGSRLYKTGDLARYRPDGVIEYLGRIDHQVKIRGFRIELGEIAAVLTQHPGVREAIAIDRETALGDKQLVAYLIAAHDSIPVTQELQAFLQQHLPEYMIPSAFVWLDTLPVTANGKLDRQALPDPEPIALELQDSFVAPRTPVEVALAGIWQEVLGLPQVGVHDNFLALGGHSLLATQVISRSRSTFQVEISLRYLFESPTIAGFAAAIEDLQKSNSISRSGAINAVSREARRVKRSSLSNGFNS